jgi:hypothetical protein
MKKFFLSLMTLSLLFTSCSNDDNVTSEGDDVGAIKGVLKFEGVDNGVKAALSTAIPITSWANVKQAQLFLYDATTGNVAYSYTFNPNAARTEFTWTNIPTGTYDVAVVANMKSSTDNIRTSLDGGTNASEWTDFNVRNRKINTQIFSDLKPAASFPAAYNAKKGPGDKPFVAPSEIFTAYGTSPVTIVQGQTVDLTPNPLALKREVALMRVRVDKTYSKLSAVKFDDPSTSILIHNQPVGFGLKLGTFAGGIKAASDKDRIIVGAQGANTFNTADPTTTTHNPTKIIDSKFTLWKEIIVFPNAAKADGKAPNALADNARKYFIMISALAPAGYTLDDGTVLAAATPVFWWGVINEVFAPNNIREVNLTIKSSGAVTPPTDPTEEGGLTIKVNAPENWASVIQDSNIEI